MQKINNQFVQMGIVKLGYGCGNPKFPGLYINLRNKIYLDWIMKIAF